MLKLTKTSSDEGDVTLYNLEKITERQLKILQTGVDNIFQGMLRQNNYNSEDYELRREVEKLKISLDGSTTD